VNNCIHKTISTVIAFAFLLGQFSVNAQTAPISACIQTGVLFGFFNGVQTTRGQADEALKKLNNIHGETNQQGEKIKYEVFYNYSAGFEDFVETFDQRLKEQGGVLQGRFELFFSSLNGGGGTWWNQLTGAVTAFQNLLSGIGDASRAAAISSLASLAATPPTYDNYAEHRLRIDNNALEGKKMLFVAHSQGNLFVNVAYQYAATKLPVNAVKVVHIAPASPTTNGAHVLADLDLVINGLRLVGSVPPITDNIASFLSRSASPLNGQKDALGHGLLEIYINPLLPIASSVKSKVNSALNSLVAPPVQAASGFFTSTLTWDGAGDIDLHVFEPRGAQVFYANKQGAAGYLDVDNVSANGPEHYYASCDTTKLQEGTYTISVANYSASSGKVATVQIATAQGVLGTKSVTLGEATGNTPTAQMFKVKMKKNTQTGKFEASL
jgi:hypothetical protein